MNRMLNERVAKDVMNLSFERVPYGWGYALAGQPGTHLLPDYSGDCRDAWEVVENLHNRGYYFSLAYDRGVPRVSVMFYREGLVKAGITPVTAVCSTMAEAVCEAALKVIAKERY